jgi:hypothetical protein
MSALALTTFGMILIVLGALALPLAGWGAALVFAAGLWTLALAAVPGAVWLVLAIVRQFSAND